MWTEERVPAEKPAGSVWTNANHPGYRIEHADGEAFYAVWHTSGLLGRRDKFAQAARFVTDDQMGRSEPAPPADCTCRPPSHSGHYSYCPLNAFAVRGIEGSAASADGLPDGDPRMIWPLREELRQRYPDLDSRALYALAYEGIRPRYAIGLRVELAVWQTLDRRKGR